MAKKKSVLSQPTTTFVGPPTGQLKERFMARSIPLETDFAALIDVADCGRKAVGLNEEFPPIPETGLNLDDTTGLLTVKPDPAGGLAVSAAGTAVKPDPAGGVVVSAAGAAVKPNPARGVIVDASGVGVNYDATLRIVNSNQLGVADKYVTKSGDSTITGGGLTFASEDKGVTFYGGSKIVKRTGSGVYWHKDSNNRLPQICDNNGNNPSNIATENYVISQVKVGAGSSGHFSGSLLMFEVGYYDEANWPVDFDFSISKAYSSSTGIVCGRATSSPNNGWSNRVLNIDGVSESYSDVFGAIVLLKNNGNNNLALGIVTGNNAASLYWRVRCNGCSFVNKNLGSFSGYTELTRVDV